MDAAWAPVVSGIGAGVVTGMVTLLGLSLTARHRRQERQDERTAERDKRRMDAVSGCFDAIARCQVELKYAEGRLAAWAENPHGDRPVIDGTLVANALTSAHHLRSQGLDVDKDLAHVREKVLEHLYLSAKGPTGADELITALSDLSWRIAVAADLPEGRTTSTSQNDGGRFESPGGTNLPPSREADEGGNSQPRRD